LTETESLGTPSRKFVYVVKDEDQEDRKWELEKKKWPRTL